MRVAVAVTALLVVAWLPTSGTLAAWDDTAAVSSAGPLTALTVPPPALSCSTSGRDAVISWPQAALPGAGAPAVGYTAQVAETGMPLTVQGAQQKSVVVSAAALISAGTWTIRVTTSVSFGATTWTAAATHLVTLRGDAANGRVTCG